MEDLKVIFLALSVCLASATTAYDINEFKPGFPGIINWIPSKHYSALNWKFINFQDSIPNHCERFSIQSDDNLTIAVFGQFRKICDSIRDEVFLPALSELTTAGPSAGRFTRSLIHLPPHRRPTRGPASSSAAFWASFMPFGDILFQRIDPESAYNTVWDHEKEISDIYWKLEIARAQLAQQIRQNELAEENDSSLIVSLQKAVAALNGMVSLLPALTHATSRVHVLLQRDADLVRELIYSIRTDILDAKTLMRLHPTLNITSYANYENMRLVETRVNLEGPQEWSFLIALPTIDLNIKFYELLTFKIWHGETEVIKFSQFQPLLMHNTTNNCTLRLERPSSLAVKTVCKSQSSVDDTLDVIPLTISVNKDNFHDETEPTVVYAGAFTLIQCAHNTIKVYNRTYPCKDTPFALSANVSFSVRSYAHQVEYRGLGDAFKKPSSLNLTSVDLLRVINIEDTIVKISNNTQEMDRIKIQMERRNHLLKAIPSLSDLLGDSSSNMLYPAIAISLIGVLWWISRNPIAEAISSMAAMSAAGSMRSAGPSVTSLPNVFNVNNIAIPGLGRCSHEHADESFYKKVNFGVKERDDTIALGLPPYAIRKGVRPQTPFLRIK